MAREKYLRAKLTVEGVEYIAGLEIRPEDDFQTLKLKLRMRMKVATNGLPSGKYVVIAEAIERVMDKYWPARKFFIEVGDDSEAWIQVWDQRDVFTRGHADN